MIEIRSWRARAALPYVELGRVHSGWPVGLRDGAILALIAAGMSTQEVCGLRASEITMDRGDLYVTMRRDGVKWHVELPTDLGARLLAWLSERRLWADPIPVFIGPHGRELSPTALRQILCRYWRQTRARR